MGRFDFFGLHGLPFHEFYFEFRGWVSLQRFSNLWLEAFPNSFLLSWRKLCNIIKKSCRQGILVSPARFSSPSKAHFSPDGSMRVVWIFLALFEMPRQLIHKCRDAQLTGAPLAVWDFCFCSILPPSSSLMSRFSECVVRGMAKLVGCQRVRHW